MSQVCRYLFVYGTLRAGTGHPMAQMLSARARLVGPGWAAGRLYDLGDYPGMVVPTAVGERVRGDVYELDEAAVMLAALDAYEGCAEGDPQPWGFARRLTAVALDGGGELQAWAYEYHGPLDGARFIPSGDYLTGD